MNSRKYLASLLALLCVLTVGALTASVADALEISRFDTNRVNDLSPGTDLTFRLEGTPQATAMVTVSGLRQPITLRETDTGVYEGSYTIRLPASLLGPLNADFDGDAAVVFGTLPGAAAPGADHAGRPQRLAARVSRIGISLTWLGLSSTSQRPSNGTNPSFIVRALFILADST